MAQFLTPAQVRTLLNQLTSETAQVISAATNASPSVVTVAGHGYSTGDVGFVVGTTGNTAINGLRTVTVVDANTFTLTDFFTGSAVNGNGTTGGSPTIARVKWGGKLGDCDDLLTAGERYGKGYPFADNNRANEPTIATIFSE